MNQRRLKLLSPGQVRLLVGVMIGAGFLVANSVYLALAAHAAGVGGDPNHLPVTYQIMLVLHVVVGSLLFLPALGFALWHLPRALLRKSRGTLSTGIGVVASSVFLFVSGLFIFSEANSEANRWAFIGLQVCDVLLPVVYGFHRWLSHDPPQQSTFRRALLWMVVAVVVTGAAHGLEAFLTPTHPVPPQAEAPTVPEVWRDPPIDDPFVPFRPVGDVDPDTVFFPSSVTTTTTGKLSPDVVHGGDVPPEDALAEEVLEQGFASSWNIGADTCDRCHPDVVAQWATSAHRFASFNNPFYRKSVELTREVAGKKESQWCGGCHDPAMMLAGTMAGDLDPTKADAQAGLTCLACHAIDNLHGITGNGNYNLQDLVPSPYILSDARSGLASVVADYVIKAKPTVHKRRMLKPFFRKSEFCAPCHKVSLPEPVNRYRWLRGQNDYDSWHNSGVPHNNPMTWYEPPTTRECQDCHMPLEDAHLGDMAAKDGKVRSHRFLAVNTALPHIRGDKETIRLIEAALQGTMRVDVFALHRNDEPVVMGIDKVEPALRAGDRLQVDVVVRNVGVGHTFPGGTNDSNEGWIRFKVTGPSGVIWESGALRPDRHVDPAAHFYKAVVLDRHGERINRRNAHDIHTPLYANVVPPSGSDIARYAFQLPSDLPEGELVLEAELLWRKFDRGFTEFVFEGKPVPDLPITRIARDEVRLRIGTDDSPTAGPGLTEDDWGRVNDYGVGLYLDGVSLGALDAFATVARLVPDKVDGWRNQARAHLLDSDFVGAESMLRRASEILPNDARTAFFWGRLLEERGGEALEEAVQAYRRCLQTYPKSRDTWERLGRTYLHLERYEDAIKAFLEVLEIDPEHALAHEKRALAYAALAEREPKERKRAAYAFASGEARKAYLKYKIDEDAEKVTLRYRERHPHDHRMTQRVVIHRQTDP
jgi:hypothetical protein